MKEQAYFIRERNALLNDTHRKQLFKKLFELYANSLPIILKKEDGTIICSYSDEVEEAGEKIKDQIRLRDNQVFASLNRIPLTKQELQELRNKAVEYAKSGGKYLDKQETN